MPLSLLLFVYEFRVFGIFQTCPMSGMIQFIVTVPLRVARANYFEVQAAFCQISDMSNVS